MNQASPARWTPHVTVATLVEKDDKFLLVREQPDGKIVYNQPAGHLDEGEGIIGQLIDDYHTGLIYPLTLFHED